MKLLFSILILCIVFRYPLHSISLELSGLNFHLTCLIFSVIFLFLKFIINSKLKYRLGSFENLYLLIFTIFVAIARFPVEVYLNIYYYLIIRFCFEYFDDKTFQKAILLFSIALMILTFQDAMTGLVRRSRQSFTGSIQGVAVMYSMLFVMFLANKNRIRTLIQGYLLFILTLILKSKGALLGIAVSLLRSINVRVVLLLPYVILILLYVFSIRSGGNSNENRIETYTFVINMLTSPLVLGGWNYSIIDNLGLKVHSILFEVILIYGIVSYFVYSFGLMIFCIKNRTSSLTGAIIASTVFCHFSLNLIVYIGFMLPLIAAVNVEKRSAGIIK